jgi:hypothetical protein
LHRSLHWSFSRPMPYPSPSGPNLIEDDSVVAGLLSPVPVRNVLPRLRRVARTLLRRSICVDRRREVDHHRRGGQQSDFSQFNNLDVDHCADVGRNCTPIYTPGRACYPRRYLFALAGNLACLAYPHSLRRSFRPAYAHRRGATRTSTCAFRGPSLRGTKPNPVH